MARASFSQVLMKQPRVAARTLAGYRKRLAEIDAGASPRANERPDEIRSHVARLEQAFRDEGRCQLCGRELRDPASVERGIGPECIRKTSTVPVGDGERF